MTTKKFKPSRNKIKFMVMSDFCLGLNGQQGDLIYTCYDIAEKENIDFAIVTGNLLAGKPLKVNLEDYFLFNWSDQVSYASEIIPQKKFKTYFINGTRELSFFQHCNAGEKLATKRKDLVYCGNEKAIFELGNKGDKFAICALGNKSTYTKSHPVQGVLENFQDATTNFFSNEERFQMVFVGGTGTYMNLPRRLPYVLNYRNDFDGVSIPSLYVPTDTQKVQKKKGMSFVTGCLIVTAEFNDSGQLVDVIYDLHNLTSYTKQNDHLNNLKIKPTLSNNAKKVLQALQDGPKRKGQLTRSLSLKNGKDKVDVFDKILDDLMANHYVVTYSKARKTYQLMRDLKESFSSLKLSTKELYVKRSKVAAISDTHLGCKDARLDLIQEAYKIAEEEQVDVITHSGDVFEGYGAYRGQVMDLTHIGADAQRDLGLEIWPTSKIPTVMVRGTSHELAFWQTSGHDVVDAFAKISTGKQNLKYLGDHKGTISVKGIPFELFHPKGSVPYGVSYRIQRRIEKLVPLFQKTDSKVFLCGHFHVGAAMLYKGMFSVLVPCMEEQTEYLASRDLVPYLGMWVLEVFTDSQKNISRVITKYVPFAPKKGKQPSFKF